MANLHATLLFLLLSLAFLHAFQGPSATCRRARAVHRTRASAAVKQLVDMPEERFDIEEREAMDMLDDIYAREVSLPDGGSARVTFVRRGNPTGPKVVLLHGFDSSCLEYRRLVPRLAKMGMDVFAVDLLGWGFSDRVGGVSGDGYSAKAKKDALASFLSDEVGDGEVFLAGASLGGAAAIEFAAAYPEAVRGLVLIDAQGFIDGVGPMAMLPKPLAKLGIKVLQSKPLRRMANDMSYFDAERFATEDAMLVGRLHTLKDKWEEAAVDFMLSGGFAPAEKVKTIRVPTIVLWGKNDKILEPEQAQRFVEEIPGAQLTMIDDCGHVPHLEQPGETADIIAAFVRKTTEEGGGSA